MKWGTAIAAYLLVISYLTFAGRSRARRGRAAKPAAARPRVNLLAARVVLRQRSLADSLDLALPFCLANKRPLGVLALVILAPIAALLAYLRIARHWPWLALWFLCAGCRCCSRACSPSRSASCCSSRPPRRACGPSSAASSAASPPCWSPPSSAG